MGMVEGVEPVLDSTPGVIDELSQARKVLFPPKCFRQRRPQAVEHFRAGERVRRSFKNTVFLGMMHVLWHAFLV